MSPWCDYILNVLKFIVSKGGIFHYFCALRFTVREDHLFNGEWQYISSRGNRARRWEMKSRSPQTVLFSTQFLGFAHARTRLESDCPSSQHDTFICKGQKDTYPIDWKYIMLRTIFSNFTSPPHKFVCT